MKRILVNATHAEEMRVAIVDGQKLYDLDIETPTHEQKKSNIYKARITRIEPSLEACFVDYGADRHGFLPFKEVSRQYFSEAALESSKRPNIKEALKEGQEVMVQVDKEERGNKGAALTTFISLAGRYLVLMPNNPRAGGVSRRIEGEDRALIREAMSQMEIPEGMGLIIRTAGVGRGTEELQWDLDYLCTVWKAIEDANSSRPAPFLIYQESNVIIRALRDYLRKDIGEILVDNEETFQQGQDFINQVMPHNISKLKLYTDETPLFTRYQIESQIESAFHREVRLPSGGSIVIDPTEALISIDINSSRATKGSDIEDTALNTNLEAADEIARQLRLRDMGGLVVIDFIDMNANRNQRAVEQRMHEALKHDRARVQIGRISRFGLLEMSRQRIRPSLGESSHEVCPRCHGQGTIRNVESLGLSILRIIAEEAMKDSTQRVVAQLPLEVASYLLNEKRDMIEEIQRVQNVVMTLVPNPHMDTPHYEITRMRGDDEKVDTISYKLVDEPAAPEAPSSNEQVAAAREVPAVSGVKPPVAPAPTAKTETNVEVEIETEEESTPANEGGGFIRKMLSFLSGGGTSEEQQEPKKEDSDNPRRSNNRGRNNNRNRNNRNRNNRNRNKDNRDQNRDQPKTDQNSNKQSGNTDNNQNQKSQGSNTRNENRNKNQRRDQKNSNTRNSNRSGNTNNRNNPRNQDPTPRDVDGNIAPPPSAIETVVPQDIDGNRAPANDNKADNNRDNQRRGRRGGRRRRSGPRDEQNENNNREHQQHETPNPTPVNSNTKTENDSKDSGIEKTTPPVSKAQVTSNKTPSGGQSSSRPRGQVSQRQVGEKRPEEQGESPNITKAPAETKTEPSPPKAEVARSTDLPKAESKAKPKTAAKKTATTKTSIEKLDDVSKPKATAKAEPTKQVETKVSAPTAEKPKAKAKPAARKPKKDTAKETSAALKQTETKPKTDKPPTDSTSE